MKTYKQLYPRICTWETLETAYRKARKGKRRKQPVADFEYNLKLLDPGQHRHVSGMLDEIGRLLGGWFKTLGAASQKQAIPELPQ